MTAKQLAALATAYSPDIYEQAAYLDGILALMSHLWHEAKEDTDDYPEKGTPCLLQVNCEFDEYPEDNYTEYTTSTWNGTGWTEDHFPSEADVQVIRWLNISDLITE